MALDADADVRKASGGNYGGPKECGSCVVHVAYSMHYTCIDDCTFMRHLRYLGWKPDVDCCLEGTKWVPRKGGRR